LIRIMARRKQTRTPPLAFWIIQALERESLAAEAKLAAERKNKETTQACH
jgi:hypothetical protein